MEESMSKAPGIGKAMAIQNAMTWFIGATAGGLILESERLLVRHDRASGQTTSRGTGSRRSVPRFAPRCTGHLLKAAWPRTCFASYSGNRQPDGGFGQAHLAELSVNYVAGLERLAEVCVYSRNQAKPNAIVPLRPRSGKHCRVS